MKRKNLNTVVKQIFENGEGIPFKEEYWNKMNEMLDEHIPVQSPSKQSFSLKYLLLEITFFTILASGQILGFITANITPEKLMSSSPQATQPSLLKNASQNPSSINENQQLITTENEQAAQSLNDAEIANTPVNNTTAGIKTSASEKESNIKSAYQNILFTSNERASIKANSLSDKPNLQTEANIPFNDNESVLTSSENQGRDMIELSSLTNFQLEPFAYDLLIANPQMLSYPYRHSFIKHVSILPYLNLTHSNENLIYKENNTSYLRPAQSRLGGGVSLELILKNIALRTGIGYNTLGLTQLTETTKNIYSYDTSYTIINPLYQTTPSGNPVALIKQQVDSTYQSTDANTKENHIQYQYLSIPFTFQYLIAYKRVQLMAEAGMINNFIINRKSTLLNNTEDKSAKLPISTYFPQVTLGTGIRYHVHSKFFVGGQYNFIHSTDNQKLSLLKNGHVFGIAAGFYLR